MNINNEFKTNNIIFYISLSIAAFVAEYLKNKKKHLVNLNDIYINYTKWILLIVSCIVNSTKSESNFTYILEFAAMGEYIFLIFGEYDYNLLPFSIILTILSFASPYINEFIIF